MHAVLLATVVAHAAEPGGGDPESAPVSAGSATVVWGTFTAGAGLATWRAALSAPGVDTYFGDVSLVAGPWFDLSMSGWGTVSQGFVGLSAELSWTAWVVGVPGGDRILLAPTALGGPALVIGEGAVWVGGGFVSPQRLQTEATVARPLAVAAAGTNLRIGRVDGSAIAGGRTDVLHVGLRLGLSAVDLGESGAMRVGAALLRDEASLQDGGTLLTGLSDGKVRTDQLLVEVGVAWRSNR